MKNAFINVVLGAARSTPQIMAVTGDAGLGVFDAFAASHPAQYLNLGIAEQNTIGFAAGLSLAGFKVYVYNIIPFLLYRPYEQVRNDLCYQRLPVTLVGIGAGLAYARAGMTHYSVEDIAIARSLPNLVVVSPVDGVEAQLAAEFSLECDRPMYVRTGRKKDGIVHVGKRTGPITAPAVLRGGSDIALIFHGGVGEEVVEAANRLADEGISVRLVTAPMLQPFDEESALATLDGCRHVLVVEEHYPVGGLASILQEIVARRRPAWTLHCLTLPHDLVCHVKDTVGMRDAYGLSPRGIVNQVRGIFTGSHLS